MEADYFQRRAADTRCLSVDAARQIRIYSIKKNGIERDLNDSNILPIPARVKEAFPNPENVLQLLRCPCRGLCVPFSDVLDGEDNVRYARDTWRQETRLQTFAVFVLSGCLFAYKIYRHHANPALPLEHFIDSIQSGEDIELQRALFEPISSEEDQSEERIQQLATLFALCMKDKLRLIRIPEFVPGGPPQNLQERKWNFPFLSPSTSQGATPGHVRQRFVIHEQYIRSTELRSRRVFCKTITFHSETSNLRGDVRHEAEIMAWLGGLKHPNIAEMLFLFTESNITVHRFNFVYKTNRYTLADIFAGPRNDDILRQFRPPPTGPMTQPSVLDHGLWKAMLGVLDAIKAIHEFSSRNSPFDYDEAIDGGHFNIKPSSILIGDEMGPPRLILAGFGQAHLQKRYIDASMRRNVDTSALAYAPPECELGAFSRDRIRACYDIWSLGCVLLEVLVYVAHEIDGHDAGAGIQRFTEDRRANGEGDDIVTSAFWTAVDGGQLRTAVTRRIRSLRERGRDDPRLAEAMSQVEAMLSVNTRNRPDIVECIQNLNSERDLFYRAAHDDLSRKLRSLTISFETANISRGLIPCNLFLWRERIERETELTLILEWAGGQRWVDSKSLQNDCIIVQTYFDTRLHYGRSEQRLRIACRFRRLHRGTTFSFEHWKDFFTFFHLMTHQQVAFGRPVDRSLRPTPPFRWGFRFQSIVLQTGSRTGARRHGRGMCQIWSTDNDNRHSQIFLTPSSNRAPLPISPQRANANLAAATNGGAVARSIADSGISGLSLNRRVSSATSGDTVRAAAAATTTQMADAMNSRFKLAIFVAREEPGGRVVEETPAVYIVELDLDDIMTDPTVSDPQKTIFRARERIRGSFSAWAPALNDSGFDGGIPLDPEVLKNCIRQDTRARVRLQRLEMEFMNTDECNTFKEALRYYSV